MPAKSMSQQRFMGMELSRVRSGKKSMTGMSEKQLSDFAKKPKGKKKMQMHVKMTSLDAAMRRRSGA